MKDLLNKTSDFKIIPSNFKSAGMFDVIEIQDDFIKGEVVLLDDSELDDYKLDSDVEVFGVNDIGLVYFETKILEKEGNIIKLSNVDDYSIIQRREYTRVNMPLLKMTFKDIEQDCLIKIDDISAGGIKLTLNRALEIEKFYDIELILSNNMKINCALCPIRLNEIELEGKKAYTISAKFVDIESADRITLVQYAFKTKMEQQNKTYG